MFFTTRRGQDRAVRPLTIIPIDEEALYRKRAAQPVRQEY